MQPSYPAWSPPASSTSSPAAAPYGQCVRCGLIQPASAFCRSCGVAPVPPLPSSWIPRRRDTADRVLGLLVLSGIVAVLLGCVGLYVLGATEGDPGALSWATLAAVVPAVGYGAVILAVDRTDPEPRRLIAFAVGWGALAAIVLAILLEVIAIGLLSAVLGPASGSVLGSTVVAPLVEESTKGVALLVLLLVLRRHLDNTLDGIVYGALIGLGFALTENIGYFAFAYLDGGVGSVGELFVVRSLVNGLGHEVYTALTGAAVGWARGRHGQGGWRLVVPFLGWSAAVAAHGLWNTGSILIGVMIEVADFSLVRASLIAGPFLSVPPLALVIALIVVARQHERETVRRHLGTEVGLGVLSPAEWAVAADPRARRQAIRAARQAGGRAAGRAQRRFFRLAIRLAMHDYHLARGERPSWPQVWEAQRWRWELAALRWSLAHMGGGQ